MTSAHGKILEEIVEKQERLAGNLDESSIYVTGASGFLASNLLIFLDKLRKKYAIKMNLTASARRSPASVFLFDFLKTIPFDDWQIASVEETRPSPEKRWIIVHTASYGSPLDYMREPFATFSSNTKGIQHFFEGPVNLAMESMVYFSTAEVHGQPPDAEIPTKETFQGGPELANPRSIYAESKRMGEVLGRTFSDKTGVPFVSLRPWNVYGPGQRLDDGRVPMEFLRQMKRDNRIHLSSDGKPTRSFCHVWEAIPQIAACLRPPAGSEAIFNIGKQGDEISVREMARLCAEVFGKSEESISLLPNSDPKGMMRCQPDTTRVRELGIASHRNIGIHEGLKTCREWVEYLAA